MRDFQRDARLVVNWHGLSLHMQKDLLLIQSPGPYRRRRACLLYMGGTLTKMRWTGNCNPSSTSPPSSSSSSSSIRD
jgi:hypothetical protein